MSAASTSTKATLTKSSLERKVAFDTLKPIFTEATVGGKKRPIMVLSATIRLNATVKYKWNVVTGLNPDSNDPEREAILHLSATALKIAEKANTIEEANAIVFGDNHGILRFGVLDHNRDTDGKDGTTVFIGTRSDLAPGRINWFFDKTFEDSKVHMDEEKLRAIDLIANSLRVAGNKHGHPLAGTPSINLVPRA